MFTLIIDDSLAYLHYLRDRELSDNGFKSYELVSSFDNIMGFSLFDDVKPAVLEIKAVDDVKSFVKSLEGTPGHVFADKVSNGFIALVKVSRTSTRKLENFFKEHGGKVVVPKIESKNLSDKILSHTNLSYDVKSYLKNYAGEDYELLVTFVRAIDNVPLSKQHLISVIDAMIRLPYPEGKVPPWNLINYYRAGNSFEMLKEFDRVIETTHPLVIITLLKNNLQSVCEIASLNTKNLSFREYLKEYSLKETYPLKLAYQTSVNRSLDSLLEDYSRVIDLEDCIKNGSIINTNKQLKSLLLILTNNMSRGK